MSYLITPTLLDAYDWFNKAPQSWKKKAWEDLVRKLNRTSWTPTAAIKRGMAFEKKVYENCNRDLDSFSSTEIFKDVCREIKGGDFQKKLKKIIVVNDKEYLLYGKTDAWFPNVIKDIKTTKEYKGKSKYLSGWQHILYSYMSGIKDFKYIVVEWDDLEKDDTKLLPGELYIIEYKMSSREENKKLIEDKIKDFMGFINGDTELSEAYYNKFNLYG